MRGIKKLYGILAIIIALAIPLSAVDPNIPLYLLNGNIGIGTTTPITTLDISGDLNVRGGAFVKNGLQIGYDQVQALGKISFHSSHKTPGDQYFTGLTYNNSSAKFRLENSSVSNVDIQFGSEGNYQTLAFQSVEWNESQKRKIPTTRMAIKGGTGFVGIGVINPSEKLWVSGNAVISNRVAINAPINSNYHLTVGGTIKAEDMILNLENWADYVLEKNYPLLPIKDVDTFIKINKHLPGVPSEKELKASGLSLAKMQTIQMKKIEELTLYIIQLESRIQALEEARK